MQALLLGIAFAWLMVWGLGAVWPWVAHALHGAVTHAPHFAAVSVFLALLLGPDRVQAAQD